MTGETLESLLYAEVVQRGEEGCDITGFRERVAACQGNRNKLLEVYQDLSALKVRADFPYQEPNDLDEILSLSTGGIPDSHCP